MDFYEIKISNLSGTIHTPYNSKLQIPDSEKGEIASQLIAEFACEVASSEEYDQLLEDVRSVYRFICDYEEGALELSSCIVSITAKHNE